MDLQQANALLLARRAALGVVPKYTSTAVEVDPTRPNYERDNALRLIEQIRERDGLAPREKRINTCDTFLSPPPARVEAEKPTAVTLKNHPLLGLATLKAKLTAVYRVWLICRHLDRAGRGWLDVSDVKQATTTKESDLYLFNYRRFRQIITQGIGTFWQETNGRLWLTAVHNVAIALGCANVGKPVQMGLKIVTGCLKSFNAAIFAAWDTRRKAKPISRAKRETVTGVPERTQRHYCRVAGIKRIANYALSTPQDGQDYAYQHGTAAFPFVDFKGKNGRQRREYTARQLPTTQQASQERAMMGRTQKVNRRINLVLKASREKLQRLFFDNAKQASKQASRGREAFWQFKQFQTFNLWSHFFC